MVSFSEFFFQIVTKYFFIELTVIPIYFFHEVYSFEMLSLRQ